jgi:hypothetical protein
MTARLRIGCSTPELLWRKIWQCPGADSNRYAFRHHPLKMACLPISPPGRIASFDISKKNGADGARTRDLSSDSRVL